MYCQQVNIAKESKKNVGVYLVLPIDNMCLMKIICNNIGNYTN